MFHEIPLISGSVAEIRDGFKHLADTTRDEFEAMKMRVENLEFRATGFVDTSAADVAIESEETFSDVTIEAEHVGLTFSELLYALRHPVRAARALHSIEATAVGSLPPASSSAPEMRALTAEERHNGEGRPAALETPSEDMLSRMGA